MGEEAPDKHPVRTLVIMVSFGVILWAGALYILLTLIGLSGIHLDSSVLNFYWVMAGCGALFGVERWLYHEEGGINPFHDK